MANILIPAYHRSFVSSAPLSKDVQYQLYLDARRKLVRLAQAQLITYETIKENLEEIESFGFDWSLDTEALKKRWPDLFFPWENIDENLSHPDKSEAF